MYTFQWCTCNDLWHDELKKPHNVLSNAHQQLIWREKKEKQEKVSDVGKKKKLAFPSIFNGVSSPSYFLGHNKIKNILQKGQKE